jgi:hypothetical protein
MRSFVDVRHDVWIAASRELVRAQFADLDHHIQTGVHPTLTLRRLQDGPRGVRYEQVVRLLGIRQRDVFERRFLRDGTMVDLSVDGFNKEGSITVSFERETRDGRPGTLVMLDVRVPLPRLIGPLIRPLVAARVAAEVRRAAEQDKFDLEDGRYAGPVRSRLRAA